MKVTSGNKLMMRTLGFVASALFIVSSSVAPASAAPGAPTAVLVDNGSCQFALTVDWTGTEQVATVYARWYEDGHYKFNMVDRAFTGYSTVFQAPPRKATKRVGSWHARVQFYDGADLPLADITSNVVSAACK